MASTGRVKQHVELRSHWLLCKNIKRSTHTLLLKRAMYLARPTLASSLTNQGKTNTKLRGQRHKLPSTASVSEQRNRPHRVQGEYGRHSRRHQPTCAELTRPSNLSFGTMSDIPLPFELLSLCPPVQIRHEVQSSIAAVAAEATARRRKVTSTLWACRHRGLPWHALSIPLSGSDFRVARVTARCAFSDRVSARRGQVSARRSCNHAAYALTPNFTRLVAAVPIAVPDLYIAV